METSLTYVLRVRATLTTKGQTFTLGPDQCSWLPTHPNFGERGCGGSFYFGVRNARTIKLVEAEKKIVRRITDARMGNRALLAMTKNDRSNKSL